MFGAMRIVVVAAIVVVTSAVRADPMPTVTRPVHPADPVLPQDLDGRRAVRGCAVGDHCVRPADTLREFELERFPQNLNVPGQSPWLNETNNAPSRPEPAHTAHRVTKPSELRPEDAWLDGVELPDLPVTWTAKLLDYLEFYKSDPRGRGIMASWLKDQGRYRDLILRYLHSAHLPSDLLYVAMIESSYDPDDSSSAGALGLWQFMPEGGRIYGLREDRWVDERRDPLRSTIAVLDYWQDLYQRFGEWQLAMAAFNVGYGAMLRSIARYNTNDYYALCDYENGLPWETCLYTPKVLAVAIVGHNRALFGYDDVVAAPAEQWDEVAVEGSVPLATIAQAAGVDEAEIRRLNPHLRHGRTPPGDGRYIVRVPPTTKPVTEQRLAAMQSQWASYDAYMMAHGERVEDVATTYGVTAAQLRKLNDVHDDTELAGGTLIVVPRVSEADRAANRAKAKAKLLGSGVDQKDGEQLIVAVPDKDLTVPGKHRVFYRVVIGDSLRDVAKAFGVTVADLAAWNGLDDGAKIHPKMVIVAWVGADFDAAARRIELLDDADVVVVTRGSPEHLDLAEARTGRVREEYVATAREPLADVARRYGLKAEDLARINQMSATIVLEKGDKIIVYRVTDPTRSARAGEQWRNTPHPRHAKSAQIE
jgi:membrane-bound lytic murein transglycosylase D